jgi:hypothetical protein
MARTKPKKAAAAAPAAAKKAKKSSSKSKVAAKATKKAAAKATKKAAAKPTKKAAPVRAARATRSSKSVHVDSALPFDEQLKAIQKAATAQADVEEEGKEGTGYYYDPVTGYQSDGSEGDRRRMAARLVPAVALPPGLLEGDIWPLGKFFPISELIVFPISESVLFRYRNLFISDIGICSFPISDFDLYRYRNID